MDCRVEPGNDGAAFDRISHHRLMQLDDITGFDHD
jgi:hypothetical protein